MQWKKRAAVHTKCTLYTCVWKKRRANQRRNMSYLEVFSALKMPQARTLTLCGAKFTPQKSAKKRGCVFSVRAFSACIKHAKNVEKACVKKTRQKTSCEHVPSLIYTALFPNTQTRQNTCRVHSNTLSPPHSMRVFFQVLLGRNWPRFAAKRRCVNIPPMFSFVIKVKH